MTCSYKWLLILEKTINPHSNEIKFIVPEISSPFFVWENEEKSTAKMAVDSVSPTLFVEKTENTQFQLTIEKEQWEKFKEITSEICKNQSDSISEKWIKFFEYEITNSNSIRFHLRNFGPDDELMFVNKKYTLRNTCD